VKRFAFFAFNNSEKDDNSEKNSTFNEKIVPFALLH
jgi:hypothetical protein